MGEEVMATGPLHIKLVEPQPVDPDARQLKLNCETIFDRSTERLLITGRIWNLTVYEPKKSKECVDYCLAEDSDGKLIGEITVNATSGTLTLCEWSRKIVAMFLTQDFEGIHALMLEKYAA